jgi:hypothetical protein
MPCCTFLDRAAPCYGVLYRTVLRDAVRCGAVQCSGSCRCCAAWCGAVLHVTSPRRTVLRCALPHSAARNFTAPHRRSALSHSAGCAVRCGGLPVVRCSAWHRALAALRGAVSCCTLLHRAVLRSAVWCGVVRCRAARCGAVHQCSAVQFCAVQSSVVQCTVELCYTQCGAALHYFYRALPCWLCSAVPCRAAAR